MTKQEIGGKENKEFYEDARKVAESCSKERLVELYLAEVQTCCELEDVLEEFELTSAEDLRNHLNFKDNMEIWEGKLEFKNKIADLEQELAELKQKAIVPKFKVGQEVWVNDWTGQLRIGRIYEVQTNAALHDQRPLITYLVDFYGNYEDDDRENDYYEEKEVFATKEEAEQKLAEIGGKDE